MANEIITDAGIITVGGSTNTVVIGGATYTGNAYQQDQIGQALSDKNVVAAQDVTLGRFDLVTDKSFVGDTITMSGNTTTDAGGAVYADSSAVTISGSTFSGNTASYYGGAIYLTSSSTATVENCTFSCNTARILGGAIFSQKFSTLTIRNSIFATATDSIRSVGALTLGGTITTAAEIGSDNAIVIETGTKLVLDLSVYSEAHNARFLSDYNAVFSSSEDNFDIAVKVNAEQTEGDYILASSVNRFSKSITLTCGGETSAALALGNSIIYMNQKYSLALKYYSLVLTVSNPIPTGIVTENGDKERLSIGGVDYLGEAYSASKIRTALDENDLVAAQDVTLGRFDLVTDKSFVGDTITMSGNTTTDDGGAVYANSSAVTISGSTFSGNTAGQNGGAVCNNSNGTATITGSMFSGNAASSCGGAVFNDGTATITNSTFSDNTAVQGGAVCNGVGGAVAIRDSVFATQTDTIYNAGGALTFGGTITTAAKISSTNAIVVETDTKLVLDLSGYSGAELTDGLLVDYDTAFAPQQSNLTISVELTEGQNDGRYVLAAGIGEDGFKESIEVFVDGSTAPAFSVTVENSIRHDDKSYSLAVDEGKLTLFISDFAVYVSNEWTGLSDNKQVDIPNGKTAFIGFNAFDNLAAAKTKYPGEKINFAGGSYGTVTFGGSESENVEDVEATNLTLLAGTFSKSVFAGNKIKTEEMLQPLSADSTLEIQGGSYAAYVMGGDYLSTKQSSAAMVLTTGSRSVDISGGTFGGLVAEGSFIAGGTATLVSQFDGDIDVTIAGGTFNNRIYGGDITDKKENSRTDIINGDISFTLDATQNSIRIGENIVCGSYGEGTVKGDVVFTVKGTAGNLTFADTSVVNGGSGNGYLKVNTGKTVKEYENYVNGTSTAVFDGFTGDFTARLALFDAISFSNDAAVFLTNAKCNLAELSAWQFADEASVAFYNGQVNDFTGDTLDIDLTKWDGTADWTLATGSSDAAFLGFGAFEHVKFDGVDAKWDDVNNRWLSASEDFALSLSESGGKKSMVLAQV